MFGGKTDAALGSVQRNQVHFQHLGIPDPLGAAQLNMNSLTPAPWLGYCLPAAAQSSSLEMEGRGFITFDVHTSHLPLLDHLIVIFPFSGF